MIKRADSTRSLGQASIGTDKPTRDKLKAAADAAGMTLSEYIRYLADEVTSNQQGVLTSVMAPKREQVPQDAIAEMRYMVSQLKALFLGVPAMIVDAMLHPEKTSYSNASKYVEDIESKLQEMSARIKEGATQPELPEVRREA